MVKVKKDNPGIANTEAFKECAKQWKEGKKGKETKETKGN
jgi:hypothetical protein